MGTTSNVTAIKPQAGSQLLASESAERRVACRDSPSSASTIVADELSEICKHSQASRSHSNEFTYEIELGIESMASAFDFLGVLCGKDDVNLRCISKTSGASVCLCGEGVDEASKDP